MEIKWNKLAVKQLIDAIEYLENNEQLACAEKEILAKIRSLPEKPEIYPPDRLKKNNDGNFYAFKADHYRISYRKLPKEIRILRVRHTSRRPFTR